MIHQPHRPVLRLFALSMICLATASCTSPRSVMMGAEVAVGTDPAMLGSAADQAVKEGQSVSATSDSLRRRLESRSTRSADLPMAILPERDLLEERIVSVDMYEAKADQFLWALAKDLGFNLVIEPRILQSTNKASMYMSQVSAREALNAVVQLFDLHATRAGNTLTVASMDQRLFPVDILASKVSLNAVSGGDVLSETGGESQQALRGTVRVNGEVGLKDDSFDTLLKAIEGIVLDPGAAKAADAESPKPAVLLDRRSQTLFVRAKPSRLRQVADFLAKVDAVRGRQVQIDMQIIDVSLSQAFQLGVDWTLLTSKIAAAAGTQPLLLNSTSTALSSVAPFSQRSLTIPAQQFPSYAGGGAVAFGSNGLSAVVNALQSFGNVKLVSNPTLRARSGEPAFVSVGTNYRYVSKVTSSATAGSGFLSSGTTTYSVETNALFSGLMVGLTPVIKQDGTIELFVHPLQSSVRPGSLVLQTLGGGNQVTLPIVDSKAVATTLSVNSGDVVVLGGLADQSTRADNKGVPGLSDTPVLGSAFDQNNNAQASRELVIVLRATLL